MFLSQDKVGIEEIQNGYPVHDDNQKVFNLPDRTVAKAFLYRGIFIDCFGPRGFDSPGYAYANDPDFMGTSKDPKFWSSVLVKFFDKYKGVYQHSKNLIKEAAETGKVLSPSGREYPFQRVKKYNGDYDWPRTLILNYIVQGLGADFVMLARLILHEKLQEMEEYHQGLILPQNTVHDSVELDCANRIEMLYDVGCLLEDCFAGINARFEKDYGIVVNVPMAAECKFGMSLDEKTMVKFNRKTFEKDYENYLTNYKNSVTIVV